MLICQDKKIKDIYYGGRKIKAAYLGTKKIFGKNSWKYAGGEFFVSENSYILTNGRLLYCTPESCKLIEENVTDACFVGQDEINKGWVYYIKNSTCYCKNNNGVLTGEIGRANKIFDVFSEKHENLSNPVFGVIFEKNNQVTFYCSDANNEKYLAFEEQVADVCCSRANNWVMVLTTDGRLFKIDYNVVLKQVCNEEDILCYHRFTYEQIAEQVTSITGGYKDLLYRNAAGEIWYWTPQSTNLIFTTQADNVKLIDGEFFINGIIYRYEDGLLVSSDVSFDATCNGIAIRDGRLYCTIDLKNIIEYEGTPDNFIELDGMIARTADNRFYLSKLVTAVELVTSPE